MTDEKYINRLADWILSRPTVGETQRDVIVSDLEFLGRRLAAFTDAGNKGVHAEVTKFEASRYITGTYLLLGDVLSLHAEGPVGDSEEAATPEEGENAGTS